MNNGVECVDRSTAKEKGRESHPRPVRPLHIWEKKQCADREGPCSTGVVAEVAGLFARLSLVLPKFHVHTKVLRALPTNWIQMANAVQSKRFPVVKYQFTCVFFDYHSC